MILAVHVHVTSFLWLCSWGSPCLQHSVMFILIREMDYLYPVPCTFSLVPCTLYLVPCIMYLVSYIVPCTFSLVPCTLCLLTCTLYPVPCTFSLVLCTLYLVPYIVPYFCTVSCTVYLVPKLCTWHFHNPSLAVLSKFKSITSPAGMVVWISGTRKGGLSEAQPD